VSPRKTAQATAELVKVTPFHPYQVSHDGTVAGPVTLPVEIAEKWQAAGLASR
jgi:hypothetical protein